jgi:hypothetical protein
MPFDALELPLVGTAEWINSCYDLIKYHAPVAGGAIGALLDPCASDHDEHVAELGCLVDRPGFDGCQPVAALGWDDVHCSAFVADNFTVDLTATLRDDGAVWLVLVSGLRIKATYSQEYPDPTDPSFQEDDHVSGSFPANIWHGTVKFQRTPDALWLATLPDGTAFTMVVWGQELFDRGLEKVCRSCQLSRRQDMFHKSGTSPDGRQHVCVHCSQAVPPRIGKAALHSASGGTRSRRSTPAGRALANVIAGAPHAWKTCPVCMAAKKPTTRNFGPDPQTEDGMQHRCRRCSGTVPGLLHAIGQDARSSG